MNKDRGVIQCPTCNESIDLNYEKCHSVYPSARFETYFYQWAAVFSEGEHEVSCSKCNSLFIIITVIQYSFTTKKIEINEAKTEVEAAK